MHFSQKVISVPIIKMSCLPLITICCFKGLLGEKLNVQRTVNYFKVRIWPTFSSSVCFDYFSWYRVQGRWHADQLPSKIYFLPLWKCLNPWFIMGRQLISGICIKYKISPVRKVLMGQTSWSETHSPFSSVVPASHDRQSLSPGPIHVTQSEWHSSQSLVSSSP